MLGVVSKALEEGRKKIRAYHGSPHDFDRFSTDKIGTGEGAQAYGRGLYFAEREATAKSYRDALDPKNKVLSDSYDYATRALKNNRGDVEEAIKELQWKSDLDPKEDYGSRMALGAIRLLEEGFDPKKNKATMYEVNIDASPDELLDYDLPLSEQSEYIKNNPNIKKLMQEDADYAARYPNNPIGERHGGNVLSTVNEDDLLASGIKGIKYADAQTRFSPKGKTHNYVVFDDKLVEIARKYGVTMPVAGAILAGTMTPEQAQAGVVTKAARESMLKYFDEAEVDNAIRQASSSKSREALTQMNIDDFLALAKEGYSPAKAAGISDVSKFDDLPFLNIRSEDGIANITGHEGRHRARRLKELGESTMPVRIKSDIRWDQQNDPKLWDYEQDYPQILFNEDGTKKSPFPFVQGDSNLLDSSALDIADIPRKTTTTLKQIDDDELLKSLFGSSAALAVGNSDAGVVTPQQDGLLKDTGDVLNEAVSSVNRGVVDGLNFFTADQVNAVLNLMGSDKRIPNLYDVPYIKEATQGNYMDEGLPRDVVRTGFEMFSPF